MKKVLSGMIAAVMTICMSVSVFASPNSSVSIKNNDSKSTPVTYEYAPDQLGETVRSIKPLMTICLNSRLLFRLLQYQAKVQRVIR